MVPGPLMDYVYQYKPIAETHVGVPLVKSKNVMVFEDTSGIKAS